MRSIILALLIIAAHVATFASTPPPSTRALQHAQLFLSSRGAKDIRLTLAHQGRAPGHLQKTDETYYYVFNQSGNKGFVIVAGDERGQVLGYADTGCFDASNIPDNMQALLDGYAEDICQARAATPTASSEDDDYTAWQVVEPLLTTNWNQKYPYNLLCRTTSDGQTPTGCVATALAQVMYYHQWPRENTSEIPAYSSFDALPPITFDWASMKDSYPLSTDLDDTSNRAVADLMLYCGHAVGMKYGDSSSSAPTIGICDVMRNCFGYNSQAREVCHTDYNTHEWERIIHHELICGRPVFYSAQSSGIAHAFVCDGFDGNGLFHINWGWGGMANGYYRLQVLNPAAQGVGGSSGCGGYSINQYAIVGLCPQEGGQTYVNSGSGVTTTDIYLTNSSGEKTTKGTYTYDANAGLSPASVYYCYSHTGLVPAYDTALGLFDAEGHILETKQVGSISLSSAKMTMDSILLLDNFGKNLNDGTYTIRGIDRSGADGEWFPNLKSESYYLKVVKSNGKFTITNKKSTTAPDLEVLDVKQTFLYGISPLCLTVLVRNNGEQDFNARLFLYMNTSLSSYEQAYIPPGGEEYVEFFFYRQTLTNKLQISTSPGPSNVIYIDEAFTLTKTNPTPKLTMVSSEVKNIVGKYLYGSILEGSATFTNPTDKEYNSTINVQLQKPAPSGSWAAYPVFIPTKIPPGQTVTVNYSFPVSVGEKINLKIYNSITTFTTLGVKTVKASVVSWTADGERKVSIPSDTLHVPADAVAVSFEELGVLDKYIINPNSNPNTLYYIASVATVPSMLKGKNVVKGHRATNISLSEGHGFHVPMTFHADKASYTRTPTLSCNTHVGWQAITLPFTVQTITSGGKAITRLKEKSTSTTGYYLWEFVGDNGRTAAFSDAGGWSPNAPLIIGTTDDCKNKPLVLSATDAMVMASPVCSVVSKNFTYEGVTGDKTVCNAYVLNKTGSTFVLTADGAVKASEAFFLTNLQQKDVPLMLPINGLPGDTNDDGMITVADVSLSIEYILKEQADGFMKCNADVNGDGSITISDVTTIVATLMSE
ncbi:MAG: C10 family peptidase [Prevotella sp.]|nr:C10 family peptidase [Prevotella sp.]